MKKILLVVALFASMTILTAQNSKLSPYTGAYLFDKNNDGVDGNPIVRLATKSINNVDYVDAYIHFAGAIDVTLLEEYGVKVTSEFESHGIVTAKVPVNSLEPISELAEIEYVEMATPIFRKLEKARTFTRVDQTQRGDSPLPQGYTGTGVVVGICDVGFEYAHINFCDTEGGLRVKRVWNQTKSYGGRPPVGYNYGVEYATEADIKTGKIDNLNDEVGHGCHVAGIAAGSDNSNGNMHYGVARTSDLVFVSVDMASDAALLNSLKYVYDYADEVDKPCVVNYSLGMMYGPHDGTGTFDVLSDELQGEGRLVVGAAGNSGGDKLHISKKYTSEADTLKTFIKFDSHKFSSIGIWGDTATIMGLEIVVVDKASGFEEVFKSDLVTTAESGSKNITSFGASGVSGKIYVSISDKHHLNNKPHFLVNASNVNLPSNKYVGLRLTSTGGTINAWTDGQYSTFDSYGGAQYGWKSGDDNSTIGEIGGTGKRTISVGAYVTNKRRGGTIGKIATFSSKGPTADGRIKPDISAPGTSIASSLPYNNACINATEASGDIARSTTVGGRTYYYGYMGGTSQAAPHVAGILATWLEADPTLTPERVREIMDSTAISDKYTETVPNNTYGRGKIDAFAGVAYILGYRGPVDIDNVKEDVLIAYPNPTPGEFNVAFVKEDENVNVEIFSITGQKLYSELVDRVDAGSVKVFSLDNVDNGVYVVRLKGDKINQSFRLIVSK